MWEQKIFSSLPQKKKRKKKLSSSRQNSYQSCRSLRFIFAQSLFVFGREIFHSQLPNLFICLIDSWSLTTFRIISDELLTSLFCNSHDVQSDMQLNTITTAFPPSSGCFWILSNYFLIFFLYYFDWTN